MKNKETTKNQIKIKRYKKTNVILPIIGGVALVGGAAAGIAIGVTNLPIVAAEESTVYVSPTTNEATLIFDMKEEVKDNTVNMSILSTEPQNSINGDAEVVFVNGGQTTTAAVVGGKVKAKVTLAFYPTVKNTYKYTFNIGMWYTNGQGKHVERDVKNLTLVYTCANFIDNTEAAKTDEEHLPVGTWKQDDVTGNWNAELVYKGFSFVGFERMPNIELTGGFLGLSTNKPFAEIINFNNSLEAGKPGSFDVRISYSLTNEEFRSKSKEELMGVSGDIIFKDYLTDEVIEVKVSQAGGITYFGQFGAAPARFKANVFNQKEGGTVIDTLAKGDVAYARATEFEPEWATPTVTWTSSNDQIATINKDTGEIYAVCNEFGEVMFTATSTVDQTISDLVTINVTDVAPDSVEIGEGWKGLALINEKVTANVDVSGTGDYNDTVEAITSNSEIATAEITEDEMGQQKVVVTAKKAGIVTVTVRSIVDETVGDTKSLNIMEAPTIEAIVSEEGQSTMGVKQTMHLSATVDPEFIRLGSGLRWYVDSEASTADVSVTVDPSDSTKATVYANSAGSGTTHSATIVAQSIDYPTIVKTFEIENVVELERIEVETNTTSVSIGGTVYATAKVLPAAAIQKVTWITSGSPEWIEKKDNSLLIRCVNNNPVRISATLPPDLEDDVDIDVTPLPTDVEITVPRTEVFAGDSIHATARFTCESGVPCQDVEWSTSDSSLATVAIDGTVSIKSTATTSETKTVDIIATSRVAPSVKASKTLTIHPKATKVEIHTPSDVKTVRATETLQATATVTPSTALSDITWSSSDNTKATVDENGLITGVAAGNATITATNIDGTSATLAITVTAAPVVPTGVEVALSATTAKIGDTINATATITPATAEDKSVTWSTSDETKAMVDANGKVHALANGTVDVIATTWNGISNKATLTIATPYVEKVEIAGEETLELFAGHSTTLTATVTGSEGVDTGVTWTSSNPEEVIIDNQGNLYAIKPTTEAVTITATSIGLKADGTHATDTISVTVTEEISVELTYDPDELVVPETGTVSAMPTVNCVGFEPTTKEFSTETELPAYVSLSPSGILQVNSSAQITNPLPVVIDVTCSDEDGHTASDSFTVTINNRHSVDEFYANTYVLQASGVGELTSSSINHQIGGTFDAEALVEYGLVDWDSFTEAPSAMTIELEGQEAKYDEEETHVYLLSGTPSTHWEELDYEDDFTISADNVISFTSTRIQSIWNEGQGKGLIKVVCQYTLQQGNIRVVSRITPAE